MSELTAGSKSRDRIIAAAIELVTQHFTEGTGLREVYAHLTPGGVAERAGLSRGLIYHHWGDIDADGPDAFSKFLSDVSSEIYSRAAMPEDLLAAASDLPDNLSDVILLLTAFDLANFQDGDSAIWASAAVLALHGASPTGHAEAVSDRLTTLYGLIFEAMGREPIPPLTTADLARAGDNVFRGFALRNNSDPEHLIREYDWEPLVEPESTQGGWTLLAITLEALLFNMTRPIGPT